MLSMKAKYALKALICMAENGQTAHLDAPALPLSASKIAAACDIPQKFLDNILQELRHSGMVEARRGIFGGYVLARAPEAIRLGDIIRVIDGPLAPIRCASLTAYQKCDDCPDEGRCRLHHLMTDVREAMSSVLDGRSLKDLIALPINAQPLNA